MGARKITPELQVKIQEILNAPATEEEKQALLDLATYDWVVTPNSTVLHHLQSFDDLDQAAIDWGGPGTTSCNRHSVWLSIPGIFSRMGKPRCKRCCSISRMPEGIGSPKNDEKCKALIEENDVGATKREKRPFHLYEGT